MYCTSCDLFNRFLTDDELINHFLNTDYTNIYHEDIFLIGRMIYCPLRGMGEKPSPSGEDFSRLAVPWKTTARPLIPFTI
jgi:hypothetical protein